MVAVLMAPIGVAAGGKLMLVMVAAAVAACGTAFASIGGATQINPALRRFLAGLFVAVALAVTVFSVSGQAAVIGDYCLDMGLPAWFCWISL